MKSRHAGFTLVEILVALSVATLLASMVYGAVRIGHRSAAALTQKSAQAEVMQLGWQYLRTAIGLARPFADEEETGNRRSFAGTANRLVLHAAVPSYVGMSGMMRIELGTHKSESGQQLMISRTSTESTAEDDAAPAERAILLESLESLMIAYFGAKSRGDPPRWHTRWEKPLHLPNAVQIKVKPKGQRAWPVLIARPLTGYAALGEDVVPDHDSMTAFSK